MRVSEALRLDLRDVDLASGVITVVDTKFGKTRQLPLPGRHRRAAVRTCGLRAGRLGPDRLAAGRLARGHSGGGANIQAGLRVSPVGLWVDHGPDGTGEPLSMMLRPGKAGSNTAADHIQITKDALRQLPFARRGGRIGRKVLIRTDGGGGTHEFLQWLHSQGLSYSVGFGLTQDMVNKVNQIPDPGWTPADDSGGWVRDGAWVTELTGMLDLPAWPPGMLLIIRAERPHPGAQLRFTDVDGNRLTAFVTNTTGGQLADLELQHRRRARCEDRIRGAMASVAAPVRRGLAGRRGGPRRGRRCCRGPGETASAGTAVVG